MNATINSGICMTFFLILSAHIWDGGANSEAEPYGRDDAVIWLKLLVLCCHEGPSMHLASTHISVSSDRCNVRQEYKGAFLIWHFEK